jgi:hypothetical protein
VAARARGRRTTGTEKQFDETLLEKLLVFGEFTGGDDARHRYPSYRELAERFGLSHASVHRFARRRNCLERRTGSGALERPRGPDAPPTAPVVAPSITDQRLYPSVREIAFDWVAAVKRGEVRIANAAELDRLLRLAADLDAEARQRELLPTGYPTIEEIEDFCERRDREYGLTSAGERGEVPVGLDDPLGDARETDTEGDAR